ncbi:Uncharacterised protein [uncultured archaeon]|nr:Uncharacterised protein [uncultured archaeon]
MKSKDQNISSAMIDDIKYLNTKYLGRVTPAIGFPVQKAEARHAMPVTACIFLTADCFSA